MLKYKKNLFVSHRYHVKLSIVIHKILKKKNSGLRVLKSFLSGKKLRKKDAPKDNYGGQYTRLSCQSSNTARILGIVILNK